MILRAKTSKFFGVAVLTLLFATPSYAAETAHFLNAPATSAEAPAGLAVQYQLALQLPEGHGLARLLLDAGVEGDDAAAAARLAAGHMGAGGSGCAVKIFISKSGDGNGAKLVRATLMSAKGQTVIERRGAALVIASETAAAKAPRLV